MTVVSSKRCSVSKKNGENLFRFAVAILNIVLLFVLRNTLFIFQYITTTVFIFGVLGVSGYMVIIYAAHSVTQDGTLS